MKKRVVSLLLCLIMALSLIPTVAFATELEVQQKPQLDWTDYASHIDVRVNAKLKIDRQSNGQSQSGYPKEVNVTVTNVTGTKNSDTIRFWRKPGLGTENEWRADGLFNSNQKITLTCTLKLSDSDETFTYTHTYTAQELENAKNTCPTKLGFDINIYAEDIQDTITKTVKFFTADKDMGLLNTTEESVTHANLVVNSEFPARPTTNPLNGYEFDGWYEADANGNKTGASPITNFPEKVIADAYYVAVWKAAAPTTGTLTVTKNIEGLSFAQVPVKAFEYIANLASDYAAAPPLFTLTVAETAEGITATNFKQLIVGTYSLTEAHQGNQDVAGYKCVTTFAINGNTIDSWDHSDPNDGPDWSDFNIVAGGTTNIVITDTYTPNEMPPANVTANIYIDKRIDVSTGSRQPDPTTFTFKAYYVGKDGKEMPIPYGEFSIRYNGTGSSITGDWTLNIPRNIFDANNNENITVFIKEVNSNVPGWTYSNVVYTLHIDSAGHVRVPSVDNKEWISHNQENRLMFANTYTYTPPARPSDPIRRQPTTTTTTKPVQSVKTGDMGIALYAVTSLLSLSGTALLIKKRKDEK